MLGVESSFSVLGILVQQMRNPASENEKLEIRGLVKHAHGARHCVYCREVFNESADVKSCQVCGASIHASCADELPHCSTLECPGRWGAVSIHAHRVQRVESQAIGVLSQKLMHSAETSQIELLLDISETELRQALERSDFQSWLAEAHFAVCRYRLLENKSSKLGSGRIIREVENHLEVREYETKISLLAQFEIVSAAEVGPDHCRLVVTLSQRKWHVRCCAVVLSLLISLPCLFFLLIILWGTTVFGYILVVGFVFFAPYKMFENSYVNLVKTRIDELASDIEEQLKSI